MKFNSLSTEELQFIQDKLKSETYFEEHVITHIDNPSGRIKFKDTRKISIGVSKKDLLSYRCKKKSAFYNCFVLILRLKIDEMYKEFHVKVFNTGKLEIPGIQSETTFNTILENVIITLQPFIKDKLAYKPDTNETVLINSNFNCGFFINREALDDILKYKYNIQSIYDPCSYPGIQCKFYYNPDIDIQNGCQISEENKHLYKNIKEVSFMIFRTGSVLIVGRCDENVLLIIYEYLKIILHNEYKTICQKVSSGKGSEEEFTLKSKDKKKKLRKKNITIEIAI
jgi:TATA-box binding protein (TBP) (component of TFIID and TFIIIB)